MIESANLKRVKEEENTYKREQTLMKRDNPPMILVTHPLIFFKDKHS